MSNILHSIWIKILHSNFALTFIPCLMVDLAD